MGVTPPIPRLMAFIDGENLVARYQSMLAEGRTPRANVEHRRDVYVWNPDFPVPGHFEPVRAFYYASAVGDEPMIAGLGNLLRTFRFGAGGFAPTTCMLYPRVFKRSAATQKTSIADVQLVVDALSQVYQGNVDTVVLLSGDGDFQALVQEVAARGRRIYVGAFSSGCNHKLAERADRFIDLDPIYFLPTDGQ